MSLEAEEPLPPDRFEEALRRLEPSFGLSLDPQVRSRLARYLSELDLWRRRVNLTGNLSAGGLVSHALESALGAQLISDGERVVDIGSGSGLPGLVLAIMKPACCFTLTEPRGKKAAFLRHVARDLGLPGVTVFAGRIEEVGGQTFDVATTRAVGNFPRRLGGDGLLRPDGRLLAWTTDPERLVGEIAGARLEQTVAVPGSKRKVIAAYRIP
jgi:16S rRNA (guanine527-N7)-methyltransferase